jgi:ASC-1-like (ASCH) protein
VDKEGSVKSAMGNNTIHKLPFLEIDRKTFELIQEGKKKIETRAGNQEYFQIRENDSIEFSCGGEKIIKRVKKISHYKNLDDLFVAHKFQEINPEVSSYEELREKYAAFPGYEQRIKKYGILVFELEEI